MVCFVQPRVGPKMYLLARVECLSMMFLFLLLRLDFVGTTSGRPHLGDFMSYRNRFIAVSIFVMDHGRLSLHCFLFIVWYYWSNLYLKNGFWIFKQLRVLPLTNKTEILCQKTRVQSFVRIQAFGRHYGHTHAQTVTKSFLWLFATPKREDIGYCNVLFLEISIY